MRGPLIRRRVLRQCYEYRTEGGTRGVPAANLKAVRKSAPRRPVGQESMNRLIVSGIAGSLLASLFTALLALRWRMRRRMRAYPWGIRGWRARLAQ